MAPPKCPMCARTAEFSRGLQLAVYICPNGHSWTTGESPQPKWQGRSDPPANARAMRPHIFGEDRL